MSRYIRRRYHFTGRVQHVGFRYTVRYLAKSYGVTGWVRNEYDGSVTVELQGHSEHELEAVISGLYNDRYIRIDETEHEDIAPDNDEKGFRVRI